MTRERYFKFSDGERTYFRASKTRSYRSGTISRVGNEIGFSSLEPAWTRGNVRAYPAVEITRAEYLALLARKTARLDRKRAEIEASGNIATAEYWRRVAWRGFGKRSARLLDRGSGLMASNARNRIEYCLTYAAERAEGALEILRAGGDPRELQDEILLAIETLQEAFRRTGEPQ